jgi:hypothetical protein
MNRPFWGILLLLSIAFAVSGCSDSKSETTDNKGDAASGADGGTATPTAAVGQTGHLLGENVPKKATLEGKWILLFYERMTGLEFPVALLDIEKTNSASKADNSPKLKVIVKSFGKVLSNPRLRQQVATDKSVHLALEVTVATGQPGQQVPTHETKMLDVLIDFRDGLARGSAQFQPMDAFSVMMVPTDLDNIQGLAPQQLPEAAELQSNKDQTPEQILDQLLNFVHAHPESPLALEMYPFIFRGAPGKKLDAATLNAEADKYAELAERWSPRMGFKARIDVAGALIPAGYMPEVSLRQIEIATKNLTEERIPVWKSVLAEMKEAVLANLALTQIQNGTPEQKTKAAATIRERLKLQPYNPIAIFELARYDEQQGKKDEALHGYAQAAVLPMFDVMLDTMWKQEQTPHDPPKQVAENLWKQLHGGKLDDFDVYLDKVYTESMPKGKGKRVEPRSKQDDNRVVLCELFTGADCGPCVAADVAFAQLIKNYAPSELVALEYHEHIPHPDALANSDTEQRFQFYFPERGGTPTFTISGKPVQAGGYLHQAEDVYSAVRAQIDLMLLRRTTVKIQLKAEPKEGTVAVTADANGSFAATDPVRMRLVLAEEHVPLRGSNGIREHDMVVRTMLGGPAGVELKDGKLHYEGKVDLKAIKQQLDDYLRAFEEAQKTTFATKPLDLTRLRLVAFVQNDQTKEVYQAAMIPFPSGPAPATAPKSQASTTTPKPAAGALSKAAP